MTASRHNVLLIQVDQMNARLLSLLGGHLVKTPNLDRLAADGCLFTEAHCNSPICMPSRASMLSGLYPSSLQQFGFAGYCDRRTVWLHREFKRAGYRLGAFGKFHVLCMGLEQWDDMDCAAPTLPEDADLARPRGNDYRSYCLQKGLPWPNDQVHGHVPDGTPLTVPSSATPEMHWWRQRSCRSDVPVADSLETWTTDRCLDFLGQYARDQRPFFAWLSYDRPHLPVTLPEEWHRKIDPESVPLHDGPTPEQMARLSPRVRDEYEHGASWKNPALGVEAYRQVLAAYYKLIEWIDSECGRVMRFLTQSGLDRHTTVVFTGDHGDEAGFRGLFEKCTGVLSEEVTRVPLIVRSAPVLTEQRPGPRGPCDAPVELVDLFPTLLDLCGLPLHDRLDGRSVAPWLLDAVPLDPHRPLFCEEEAGRSVVRDGWKLVFSSLAHHRTLHHLQDDPWCFENLYDSPDHSAIRVELKRHLLAHLMKCLHGGFGSRDVQRIEHALDEASGELALCDCSPPDQVIFFRAAAMIRRTMHTVLVPFYDRAILLFPFKPESYQRQSEALPFDPAVVEAALDFALGDIFGRFHSISVQHRPYCEAAGGRPDSFPKP
jgi:arylsulfatase A-like enzyme